MQVVQVKITYHSYNSQDDGESDVEWQDQKNETELFVKKASSGWLTMGIAGLLPVLKSITETKTLDEYRGHTLAIDGYCWLHRAIYSCSQEICLGQETDKYITYFMDRIAALRHNGVIPYVVFDGGPLPMKKGTEEERRKSRQKNREMGIQHYNKRQFSEARKCFVRAADVSPAMAHRVIQHLRAQNVLYVVAPYEADAQLAYLVKNGLADGVITEDSDCLPFGCQTVLFKMDRDNVAQEIQTANLKKNKGKVRIPATYEGDFKKALLTFRHQRVYCPKKQDTSSDAAPLAKETAFSRMMRAGSMLQQHKLKKRKTLSSGFRGGTLRAPQAPLSAQIERYAFTSKAKSVDRPSMLPDSLSEQTTEESTSQNNEEPENETPTLDEGDGAECESTIGTDTSEVMKQITDEIIAEDTLVQESTAAILAPSSVVSFDRFRFHD
ncbi:hypothetical protein BBO99_00006390 [Phytophthora kernoviae]|uniref:Uncharacterized protein n=1 Tax=Phytophthora kernoviae TaxID=325452 RepID=A0A3R7HUY1_9STRA|nr:hypothetical protein JM18_007594 [Phytophthora kernoviae]RLN77900.1 hypothetical protein BBO99_00006390 [Phytophthora kernoviae]